MRSSTMVSAVPAEHIDCAAELIGFRAVLGVIHDRIGAARHWQRHIECFRLGARANRRSGDDFERRSERETRQRAPGLLVVAFDDEFHVEFFRRIIRYYGANATGLPLSGWICEVNGRGDLGSFPA